MAILFDEGLGTRLDEGGFTIYDEGGAPVPTAVVSNSRIVFAVGPASGDSPVQQVSSFGQATFKRNLKTGPELQFTMPSDSPAALLTDGLATDVWVFKNGGLWMRCRTFPVDQVWGESGEDDATVIAAGYKRVVGARYVYSGPPTYTAVDQGLILWGLVQHTQGQTGGNLGIGLGSVVTGQVRDRTEYQIGDSLGKLMDDLGDVINGVWWDIDANKLLQARLLSAFDVRPDPITLGANARKMTRKIGRSFANVVGAIGDKLLTTVAWAVDAGVATDPRGRWEAFDSTHTTAKLQPTVQEYADGGLADRLHPSSQWTIALDPSWYFEKGSDYAEGQFVNIVVPVSGVDEIGVPAVSVMAQITDLVVSMTDDGGFTVTITAVETA